MGVFKETTIILQVTRKRANIIVYVYKIVFWF